MLIAHSKANEAQTPQHIKHSAESDCMPSKYQPPPLNNPDRPFVVSKGMGLSAKSPTATTPSKIGSLLCSLMLKCCLFKRVS